MFRRIYKFVKWYNPGPYEPSPKATEKVMDRMAAGLLKLDELLLIARADRLWAFRTGHHEDYKLALGVCKGLQMARQAFGVLPLPEASGDPSAHAAQAIQPTLVSDEVEEKMDRAAERSARALVSTRGKWVGEQVVVDDFYRDADPLLRLTGSAATVAGPTLAR